MTTNSGASSSDHPALPIIPLNSFPNIESLGSALYSACTTDGFFYLSEHGISSELINEAFDVAGEYFVDAPSEERIPGIKNMGYTAVRAETLDSTTRGLGDLKESFYMTNPAWKDESGHEQSLPPTLQGKRERFEKLIKSCDAVADKVLRGLGKALGLEEDFLSKHHTGLECKLRMIHYPPVQVEYQHPDPTIPDIRAGAHTDYGSITLLFQHAVSGLQVFKRGEWLDVAPLPGCLVINIGDALEFWSGGQFTSTLHRVVMPRTANEAKSRFSIAYFVQPENDTRLDPLLSDSGISEEAFEEIIARKGLPRGTRDLTGGEYLRIRIDATYKAAA
ncbi:hypothetical protein BCR39DRAFT_520065 [Naematelia encephala]|uniref:Fe2OG dioxygenase domain-containing protein n=1 Tax=Naematelia encephala TaxID=71784 RepID=A0A1Y2BF45_9TREE|nr:hypothetical protein BCR39DRAFT_520065 [Naematelia encephala]